MSSASGDYAPRHVPGLPRTPLEDFPPRTVCPRLIISKPANGCTAADAYQTTSATAGYSLYFTMEEKHVLQNSPFPWQDMGPHLIRGSLGPMCPHPNGISIGSAVLAQPTVGPKRQTNTQTHTHIQAMEHREQ